MAEEYGVTKKGFVLKRYDTILSEVQSDCSAAFGFDVSQNPQSLLNSALIVPFCDKISSVWEMGQEVYNAHYPSSAEGINLDNVAQYENVFREGNLPSEYIIHVQAEDGTTIPRGSLIASATNPVVQLQAVNDTDITRKKCHAISIDVAGNVLPGDYIVQMNAAFYSYTAKAGNEKIDILEGLKKQIETDKNYRVELVNEDETDDPNDSTLVVTDIQAEARDNDFVLSNNLTTTWVTGCVHYYTVDYGDIYLPQGAITEIVSNIPGMISVNNTIEPTPGRTQQTDTDLREDYVKKAYVGATTQTRAIQSGLLDEVNDVKAVVVYENDQDEYDECGRPPHSIEVVVDGGSDEQIADVILKRKCAGIYTFGEQTVDVLGAYGDIVTVRFNRPEPVYVWVKVEITQGTVALDPEYKDIVTDIVLNDASMTIGDPFLSQNYINPIYKALPGIRYCDITVAVGSETEKPDDNAFYAGNVETTQRQKIVLDEGRIEVTLKKRK